MKRIEFGKMRQPIIAVLPTITYCSYHNCGYKIAEINIWFIHWDVFVSIVLGKKKEQEYDRGTAKES